MIEINKYIYIPLLIALLGIMLIGTPATSNPLEDFEQRIDSLSSLKASFKLLKYNPVDTMATEGDLWVDWENKRLRYETESKIIIFKGGKIISYRKENSNATRRALKGTEEVLVGKFIDQLKQKFNIETTDQSLTAIPKEQEGNIKKLFIKFSEDHLPKVISWKDIMGNRSKYIFGEFEEFDFTQKKEENKFTLPENVKIIKF